MRRAKILKIKGREGIWTEDELNLLKKYYPMVGRDTRKYLMTKTVEQIISKAQRMRLAAPSQKKKVRCIDMEVVFDSIAGASRETGINSNCIINACTGKCKTAGGYHWEYVEEEKDE